MRRELAFGPVMRRRADFLRRRSLIDHGDGSEELVVVRAEAPGVPRHRVNGAA
jgi:release factor glutamine methyltransferase